MKVTMRYGPKHDVQSLIITIEATTNGRVIGHMISGSTIEFEIEPNIPDEPERSEEVPPEEDTP